MSFHVTGLMAAVFTPMKDDGSLRLEQVPPIVDRLAAEGVRGLYVCGSTGEGVSLSGEERRLVAGAYTEAARGKLHVIVQAGHNSLVEARELAAHAQRIGADAVSAAPPSYFTPESVDVLVDCMAEVAAGAPDLPFYYYHIPALTGVEVDAVELLRTAADRIPNLAGLKYTCPQVNEFQACLEFEGGRFDVLWGTDEMLLSALVAGARGAVGSTYNFAAPLYLKILNAVAAGDLEGARAWQMKVVTLVRRLARFPFHPAMKDVMRMLGNDCGPCRLPRPRLTDGEKNRLREKLDAIGFFEWGRQGN